MHHVSHNNIAQGLGVRISRANDHPHDIGISQTIEAKRELSKFIFHHSTIITRASRI